MYDRTQQTHTINYVFRISRVSPLLLDPLNPRVMHVRNLDLRWRGLIRYGDELEMREDDVFASLRLVCLQSELIVDR